LRAAQRPQVSFRRKESIAFVSLWAVVILQCIFIDGPFEWFDAPYGHIARARRSVRALGGDFDEVERGQDYEITLRGDVITDDTLMQIRPYLEGFSVIHLRLEETSVTCAGAANFQASMNHCVIIELPDCKEIEAK
jgi:hypothetical protein